MSIVTKEWLLKTIAELEEERDATPGAVNEDAAMALAAMKLALASLEAEPLGYIDAEYAELLKEGAIESGFVHGEPGEGFIPLFTVPPAPVSVPDDEQCKPHPVMAIKGELGFLDHFDRIISERDEDIDIGQLGSSNYEALMLAALDAFRGAIQKGVEPVTIKANGGGSEKDEPPERGWVVTHSGKDYFYREQGEAATHMNAAVESGRGVSLRSFIPEPVTTANKLPFEQWLSQQTGIIDVECGCVMTEVFFHWLRVAYEAGNSPLIPDGWKLVPVEPTEHMIVEGFESEPDEFFSDAEVWEAYDAMSGCQQAAHRAKLCWAAMIAAAPKQEVK